MPTTTVSLTTTARSPRVRFAVNEAFEVRKELLDDQRSKERKRAKALRRKRKMKDDEVKLKNHEEMELFFGFLNRMGRAKRDEILQLQPVYWVNVAAALSVVPQQVGPTLDAFDRFLTEFGKGKKKDHSKYKMAFMQPVLTALKQSDTYTPQDRFLQFLFGFDDATLKVHLLQANGQDGVNVDGLLQAIYFPQARGGRDPMALFLMRNLRMDILKERDRNDAALAALAQRTPEEEDGKQRVLPPVDRAQVASGDGDRAYVQIPIPIAEPTAVGTDDARVSFRVQGIVNLENAFIAMNIYRPPDDGTNAMLKKAGSSDASESTVADNA